MSVVGGVLGGVVGDVLGLGDDDAAPAEVGDAASCVQARSRLPQQLKGKAKFEALVCALATPAQAIADAYAGLEVGMRLANAAAKNLDSRGRLVGQVRAGPDDTTYRRYIGARIGVNRSRVHPEDLIKIARTILNITDGDLGHVIIRAVQNATLILEIRDLPVSDDVAKVLKDMLTHAVGGGVRIVIVYSRVALASTFRLDSGPGLDQGRLARGVDSASTI
jgi:hypothetical protein